MCPVRHEVICAGLRRTKVMESGLSGDVVSHAPLGKVAELTSAGDGPDETAADDALAHDGEAKDDAPGASNDGSEAKETTEDAHRCIIFPTRPTETSKPTKCKGENSNASKEEDTTDSSSSDSEDTMDPVIMEQGDGKATADLPRASEVFEKLVAKLSLRDLPGGGRRRPRRKRRRLDEAEQVHRRAMRLSVRLSLEQAVARDRDLKDHAACMHASMYVCMSPNK